MEKVKITEELLIDLLGQGLSSNEIGKRLGYTGTGIRYHMKKYGLESNYPAKEKTPIIDGKKKCSYCKEMLDVSLFSKRANGNLQSHCNKCSNKRKLGKPKEIKSLLVEEYGGECSICGYNKNLASLEFHHLDPEEKEFSLSKAKTVNLEKLRKELNKCILVCSNCHKEIHYPNTKL